MAIGPYLTRVWVLYWLLWASHVLGKLDLLHPSTVANPQNHLLKEPGEVSSVDGHLELDLSLGMLVQVCILRGLI